LVCHMYVRAGVYATSMSIDKQNKKNRNKKNYQDGVGPRKTRYSALSIRRPVNFGRDIEQIASEVGLLNTTPDCMGVARPYA